MTKYGCMNAKDTSRIIRDDQGQLNPLRDVYYDCPGPADPERAWLCEQCPAAEVVGAAA